jgi:RNA polymerase sigma-70 factor (ECF subfamily)
MFEDEIVPGTAAARVLSTAQSCPDSSKPSPPQAQRVRRAPPDGSGAVSRRTPFCASSLEEEVVSLFDQMQDRLLRYLFSIGLPTPDGEEIVQEVFLALFQHLQRGKPRHNLCAWVFQVAHNLALKRRNITQRNRQTLLQYGGTSAENFFMDPAPSPEDELARTQRQTRLHAVLRALPEQDRHCLALRAEGLTYREIARVLDISLGSVSLSLGRSLERFARADER